MGHAIALPLFKEDDLGEGITATSIPIASSWCHRPCSHSTLVVAVVIPAATASVFSGFAVFFALCVVVVVALVFVVDADVSVASFCCC